MRCSGTSCFPRELGYARLRVRGGIEAVDVGTEIAALRIVMIAGVVYKVLLRGADEVA